MTESDVQIHKGLAGVVVDTTEISSVDAASNSLLYRGYPVQQLAASRSFEEVAYLLWHGELPTEDQLAALQGAERLQRGLDDAVVAAIQALPLTCHPMDVVRTAVSVLGAHDPTAEDSSPEANLAKSVRLFAQLPGIVALDQRRRRGEEPIEPRQDLGFAENLLERARGGQLLHRVAAVQQRVAGRVDGADLGGVDDHPCQALVDLDVGLGHAVPPSSVMVRRSGASCPHPPGALPPGSVRMQSQRRKLNTSASKWL